MYNRTTTYLSEKIIMMLRKILHTVVKIGVLCEFRYILIMNDINTKIKSGLLTIISLIIVEKFVVMI